MLRITLKKINSQIIDVRMKNKMNEHINKILNNKGKIKKNIIENETQKITIKKHKKHIIYIYKEQEYEEKYEIFKMENDYISEYNTKNKKQISIFKKEKEVIKHIEKPQTETTYVRTYKENIILIEKTEKETKYYIGINENKYENYIPNNIIYTEIEYEDFIAIISKQIKEEEILKKYCISYIKKI